MNTRLFCSSIARQFDILVQRESVSNMLNEPISDGHPRGMSLCSL